MPGDDENIGFLIVFVAIRPSKLFHCDLKTTRLSTAPGRSDSPRVGTNGIGRGVTRGEA
jgi:hypothetical protein